MKDSESKACIQLVPKCRVEIVLQELKEAYYAGLSASKASTTATVESSKDSKPAEGKSKLLVKKKVAEDPFASDDEADLPKKRKMANVGGKRRVAESESEESNNKSSVKRKKVL